LSVDVKIVPKPIDPTVFIETIQAGVAALHASPSAGVIRRIGSINSLRSFVHLRSPGEHFGMSMANRRAGRKRA